MTTNRNVRPSRQHTLLSLFVLGVANPCAAAALDVSFVGADGEPIKGAVVFAMPSEHHATASPAVPTATMDQANNEFVPQVLVVQTGTSVIFPNNDTVSHHVYSFSDAKMFELALYKGNAHPPLAFDEPGLIVLGCNIHDSMLGYIWVVDTPYFGMTDGSGKLLIDALPAGQYSVQVWTPRARPADLPAPVTIDLRDAPEPVAFQLEGKLLPEHNHGGSGLSWQRY